MRKMPSLIPGILYRGYQQWARDAQLGMQNLLAHGLRSLLTMLGMIFGVAAVVAMLSIGAGARQKVMALIEQMGVRNLIVEAKETTEWQAHQKIRKISPGLTFEDYRVILSDIGDVAASTPRKRMTPTKTIPKSQQDLPTVYGVEPSYQRIAGPHSAGRTLLQSGRGGPRGCGLRARHTGPLEHVRRIESHWQLRQGQ